MKMSCKHPSTFSWADALPKVMYNMNTDYHSNTKSTAFKITFGQTHYVGSRKRVTDLDDSEKTLDSYD